jgi:hypothetical protein
VVLKIALRQLHCKTQAPNPATPYDQGSSYFGCALGLSASAMRVILF